MLIQNSILHLAIAVLTVACAAATAEAGSYWQQLRVTAFEMECQSGTVQSDGLPPVLEPVPSIELRPSDPAGASSVPPSGTGERHCVPAPQPPVHEAGDSAEPAPASDAPAMPADK